MSKLDEILNHKRKEISERKNMLSLDNLKQAASAAPTPRGFRLKLDSNDRSIIAEVKKRSPSAGTFRKDFDPLKRAKSYERGGACCLSILTDECFFGGSLKVFRQVRERVKIPCMVKDFILDPWQLYEARSVGADAYLLIARILSEEKLSDLLHTGRKLGMDCLFEINSRAELDTAVRLGAKTIGINNRDLSTFKTDLAISRELAPLIPKDRIGVALSGITDVEDILQLEKSGISCYLIGESLSRTDDPESMVLRFCGGPERAI